MTISKEQVIFDINDLEDSDNIGAFVRSSDGTLITHTSDGSKKRLDTDTGLDDDIANISILLESIDDKTVALNLREQILKAADRDQVFTYADFGTKNERITLIEYSSPSVPATVARKEFNYILDGNSYRRTTINWIMV